MLTGLTLPTISALADALVVRLNDTTLAGKMHLFQNNIIPTVNSAYADFVEANFVGYAFLNVVSFAKLHDSINGGYKVYSTSRVFTAGALTAAQTVYGWWIGNNASTEVEAFAVFDQPYTFQLNGDAMAFIPQVYLGINTGQQSIPPN